MRRDDHGPGARSRPSVFPEGYDGIAARDVALADGTRLRLVTCGDEDAPPLLLVHGFGASAYQWRLLMPRLAAAGWRVLAPDLPGHGFSQLEFAEGEYSRAAYARRMWMLADALGVQRVALLGHSMGGAVAAEMAWQAPARVARLVLSSPAGFGEVPRRAHWAQVIPDAAAPLATPLATRPVARLILRDVYGPDSAWTTKDEEELLAPYAQPTIFRALLRTLKEFDWSLHEDPALARLPRETLVLFGTHDKVVQPVDLARRVAVIPGGRLVTLPRIGHLPHVESVDVVAREVLAHFEPVRVELTPR